MNINKLIVFLSISLLFSECDIGEAELWDICYSIEENEWNGKKSLQLRIKDIKI